MRITFQPVRQTQSGFALVVVLTFLVVSLVIFASVMVWVSDRKTIKKWRHHANHIPASPTNPIRLRLGGSADVLGGQPGDFRQCHGVGVRSENNKKVEASCESHSSQSDKPNPASPWW